MDSSYHHIQSMGQSPFFYYNPDPKPDNRQHGHFSQQPSSIHIPIYHSQVHQLPSTPIYSRPNSSGSQPMHPPQMYNHTGFTPNMTPMASPQPVYQKNNVIMQEQHSQSRLMIDPNIHDGDMYYYPSTPPLSASASSLNSPANGDSLATPMNAIFYGIDGVKGVCQMDPQVENIVGPEWAHIDSPPMTPGFIQPQSLMSNGTASDLLSAPSCSSLSPSPSPHPNSAHSDDLDFCDPRNLTVGPGPSTDSSLAKTASAQTFPPLPTLCAGDDEEHRYMLGGETIHKAIDPSSKSYHLSALCTNGLPIFDQLSELDTEDDLNGWVNFPTTDNIQFFGAKRQRTASGSDLVSLHSEQFMGEDDPEEVEESDATEQFATAQLHNRPLVAVSERKVKKERRAKKTKKALCDEDSTEFDNLVRSRKYTVAMQSAGGEATEESVAEAPSETAPSQAGSSDGTNGNIAGSDAGAMPHAPVTRRGRKQSLTEDPSKTFVCDLCNRRFRRQEHLKRHYRSLHTQDKPFECHECGKKFSRSDNLSQHARTHGSGAIVMGVLEDGELHGDLDGSEGEHIQNLGSVLFRVAAATSGSDTERTSEGAGNSGDESQSRKKRKRSE